MPPDEIRCFGGSLSAFDSTVTGQMLQAVFSSSQVAKERPSPEGNAMAYISRPRSETAPKFIHSTIFLVAVPLGLCALAAAIHWLAAFA